MTSCTGVCCVCNRLNKAAVIVQSVLLVLLYCILFCVLLYYYYAVLHLEGCSMHCIPCVCSVPDHKWRTKSSRESKIDVKVAIVILNSRTSVDVKAVAGHRMLRHNFWTGGINLKLGRSKEHLKHSEAKSISWGQFVAVSLCVPSGLMKQEWNNIESSNLVHRLSIAGVTCIAFLRSRGERSRWPSVVKPRHEMHHDWWTNVPHAEKYTVKRSTSQCQHVLYLCASLMHFGIFVVAGLVHLWLC